MCGINGILRLSPDRAAVDGAELRRTRDSMAARGPDGIGEWTSPGGSIGLGHRRLAIIDLSDAGLQPMSYENGRYRIVFNGEIYNYRELRRQLLEEGAQLETHSDTEVLLALYAKEGPAMLGRLRGMYALAVWDEREQRLFLARDPFGIKPLYYATTDGYLRFASQVRALEASSALSSDVDPAGVVGFLLWGFVPEPRTLRRDVRSLPAGSYLLAERGRVELPVIHHRFSRPGSGPAPDVSEALRSSVHAHLESDVPVAIFLSSGLDSSMIAALARAATNEPPTTLTLRFEEYRGTASDEAPLAAEIARKLGTRHCERTVRRADFLDLWPSALAAMDQPSIDGFNTFVISRAVREEGFKVVLSGLGGDELFGGYSSFRDIPSWLAWSRRLGSLPGLPSLWPAATGALARSRPKVEGFLRYGGTLPGAYFLRRGLYLPDDLPAILGDELARTGLAAYDPVADARSMLGVSENGELVRDAWEGVHILESSMYMRSQLLRDSDWASMAHSVELRVPLVDARLEAEVAASGFEPARTEGKAAVVRMAAPELVDAVWTRPKSGFSIPVMRWLQRDRALGARPGLDSRRLALLVLAAFGVEVRGVEQVAV